MQETPTQPSNQNTTDTQPSRGSSRLRRTKSPQNESFLMKINDKTFAATISILAVVFGVVTGFGVHSLQASRTTDTAQTNNGGSGENIKSQVAEGSISKGDVFGTDAENFSDNATGYLVEGGLDGEGSHRLLRPGGESQTVYLTSSITDMSDFEGMEIQVWGETFKGQKAGWLMDVGRVEVKAVEGERPN